MTIGRSRGISGAHLRPGFGCGEVTLEATADAADVLAALNASFENPGYQPPVFPATAVQLLQLTRKVGVNMTEVTALLEKDPLVAARVLRVAGSPEYGRGQPVRSMHQAVIAVGLDTMATLFLQVSVGATVFRAPGFDAPMRQLRRHSEAVARISRAICRRSAIDDEHAFLCGLLHDVGLAAAAIELAKMRRKGRPLPIEESWPIALEVHEAAGSTVCRHWGLSEEVRDVVTQHHAVPGGKARPMACVVRLADWIADSLGTGLSGQRAVRPSDDECIASGISSRQLAIILEEAKLIVARLSA